MAESSEIAIMTEEIIPAELHTFIFEGCTIRTFDIEGCRFAVGADICKGLEISNVNVALSRLHVEDKITLRRSDTVSSTEGIWEHFAPQVQSVVLVTESGATDLVIDSRKPQARAFRYWLTHVVWPSIRDTGSYSVRPALPPMPKDHAAALRAYADEIEAHAQTRERVAELQPKGEAYDHFISSGDALHMKLAGEYLGWGRNQLLARLREEGILRSGGASHNLPYAKYDQHFRVAPWTHQTRNGKTLHVSQTFVRADSLDWVRHRVGMGPRKPRPCYSNSSGGGSG